MEPRFNYFKAAPEAYKALSGMEAHLQGCARRVSSRPMLVLALLITSTLITNSTLMAQKPVTPPMTQETITPLMSKDLAGFPDKEVLMYTVDFPAGFSSAIHRHNAQVSVYVLEGSVVMQVRGGKEITLRPGQSFYEDPNDIHVVSRNASNTSSAKFLVFLIHKKGAPLVIPAR
jgi:quercetin dioxygenase-like cupin family protein